LSWWIAWSSCTAVSTKSSGGHQPIGQQVTQIRLEGEHLGCLPRCRERSADLLAMDVKGLKADGVVPRKVSIFSLSMATW
jgi:hypothetical protein